MTSQEIAARHSLLPGFTLVDVVEAALPFYIIDVEALVISKKGLPLTDEFLLRSINAGLNTREQLTGFLGLTDKFVQKRLAKLLAYDSIRPKRGSTEGSNVFSLTASGEKTLQKLQTESARRENLTYLYDGITRNLVTLPRVGTELIRPVDVRNWGLLEIPSLPSLPPDDTELRGLDFNACVPSQIKKAQKIHQVISLERIGQRRKKFREVVMLVFRGSNDADIQVFFFCTNGRALPETDQAFARKQGKERLNIIQRLKDSRAAAKAELEASGRGLYLEKKVLEKDQKRIQAAVKEGTLTEIKIGETERKLSDPDSQAEATKIREELQKLRDELKKQQDIINSYPYRRLMVYEHEAVFNRALREAQNRLLIISPWIKDDAMTKQRVDMIHGLASRGVKIYIGYGISDRAESTRRGDGDPEDTNAYKEMAKIASDYPNFKLARLGNTHAKILIVDSAFWVNGSFNWMSFRGDRNAPFREEYSTMITNPRDVDREFDHFVKRFTEPAPAPKKPKSQRR